MGEWKHAGTIDIPSDDSFILPAVDGTVQILIRNGTTLEHWARGSQNPFPLKKMGTVPGSFSGCGNILIHRDGNYLIGWPSGGKLETFWSKPNEWPDPSEPEPNPPPDKHEEYHINWIGLLPWMMTHPNESIDTLVRKTRETGASCLHSFAWVGEDYFLKVTPWKWAGWNGEKVDFTQLNPDFKHHFKRLAQACKDNDMDFMPILFMSRYNDQIFTTEYNINGVTSFYAPEALEYQKTYTLWCLQWLKEVYGNDYKPTVQLINEPNHNGSDAEGHIIADWHRDIGDLVLQHTDKKRLWFDSSHSEYVHAWFVEPHDCPKCNRQFGRVEFADRPCVSESHGCSTLKGFKDNGIDAFFGSAWKHGAFNEDGSDSGSKLCDGIPQFRQANTAEYTTALTYVKNNQGGKQAYIVAFPVDPIKDKKEDYSEAFVLTYDWERLNVYNKVNG